MNDGNYIPPAQTDECHKRFYEDDYKLDKKKGLFRRIFEFFFGE